MVQPFWKKCFAVSYKYALTITPSSYNPKYLCNRNENAFPNKDSYRDIYRNFIHNCQNLENPQMSIIEWIGK